MSMLALRDAIVADFTANIAGLAHCGSHPGRLDPDDIAGLGLSRPCVLVGLLGMAPARGTGTSEQDRDVRTIAYVLCDGTGGAPHDEAAMGFVEAILERLPDRHWALTNVEPLGSADLLEVENLSVHTEGHPGVSLWSISWQQTLRLGQDVFETDGTMPTKIYFGWAPKIGAAHEADYKLVVDNS